MFLFYFSMGLTIASNVLYHAAQKATPAAVNPFVSLVVTYLTATALCLVGLLFFPHPTGVLASLRELNWASYGVAFAIAGLELGFLLAYRAGWNISLAALFSNAAVTMLLLPLGLLLFREKLSTVNVAGIAVCLVGLVLMNQR